MLIFYDQNGTILNDKSQKDNIVGNIYCIEIEMQENKILNRIDVSQMPHVAIFIDKPKTEVEILNDKVNLCLGMLSMRDTEHDALIKDLAFEVRKLNTFINEKFKIQ